MIKLMIDVMFDMEWQFGEQNIFLLFHLDWKIITKYYYVHPMFIN
jgi:hypothetical protein